MSLIGGGFNWSTQRLLILQDGEVRDGSGAHIEGALAAHCPVDCRPIEPSGLVCKLSVVLPQDKPNSADDLTGKRHEVFAAD
jgi:hypothetical protein